LTSSVAGRRSWSKLSLEEYKSEASPEIQHGRSDEDEVHRACFSKVREYDISESEILATMVQPDKVVQGRE
jgi:hypothetical protein